MVVHLVERSPIKGIFIFGMKIELSGLPSLFIHVDLIYNDSLSSLLLANFFDILSYGKLFYILSSSAIIRSKFTRLQLYLFQPPAAKHNILIIIPS